MPAEAAVVPKGLAGAAAPRLVHVVAGGTRVLTSRLEATFSSWPVYRATAVGFHHQRSPALSSTQAWFGDPAVKSGIPVLSVVSVSSCCQ